MVFLLADDPDADGMKALAGQKYEEAAKLFAHAVEKDGDDYSAQFQLGLSLRLLNRDAEAMAPRSVSEIDFAGSDG